MATFIDTHCHLNDPQFEGDLDLVLERGRQAGVAAVIVPGYDLASSEQAVSIACSHPDVRAAVGFHPHHASAADDSAVARLEELALDPGVVAIGEIGLDFYRDLSPRD